MQEKRKKEEEKDQVRSQIYKKNYLREVMGNNSRNRLDEDIPINLKNLSQKEKFEMIMLKAKRLEEKAMMEEKFVDIDPNDNRALQK